VIAMMAVGVMVAGFILAAVVGTRTSRDRGGFVSSSGDSTMLPWVDGGSGDGGSGSDCSSDAAGDGGCGDGGGGDGGGGGGD
jgi:hypothetical protein